MYPWERQLTNRKHQTGRHVEMSGKIVNLPSVRSSHLVLARIKFESGAWLAESTR
jgi:hypothetical protein